MKPHHLIAPAVALVGIIFVIDQQEDTLTVLREKTRVVEERLGMVEAARSADDLFSSDTGDTVPEADRGHER